MFVYERDGAICVTFKDTKPVEEPEYVIAVDEEAGALYMVSGTIEAMPEVEETPVETTLEVAPPTIEELDDIAENDYVAKVAPVVEITEDTLTPATDELRERFEEEPESVNDEAPLVETTTDVDVPSVEELDNIPENDPVEETTSEDTDTESDAVIDEMIDGPEVE